MRTVNVVLGALLAIVAASGTGAAALIVVEQAGSSASAAVDATLSAAHAVTGVSAGEELDDGATLVAYVVGNQAFVVNHVVSVAAERAALPRALADQAVADANFAAQTELQWALTSMEYERNVALCLGHPDPALAAACAQAVTEAWLGTLVEA